MLKLVNNIIPNARTSLFLFTTHSSVNIKQFIEQNICLTIEEVDNELSKPASEDNKYAKNSLILLEQKEEIMGHLNNVQAKLLTQINSFISDPKLTHDNEELVQTYLEELQIKLTKTTDKNMKTQLTKQISLLKFFQHVSIKSHYLSALLLLLMEISNHHNRNTSYLSSPTERNRRRYNMLKYGSEYIIKMEQLLNERNQYQESLSKFGDFHEEIQLINSLQYIILDQHKNNITYIEEKLNLNAEQCCNLTIKKIEELNQTNPESLWLIIGLIDSYKVLNIKKQQYEILEKLNSFELKISDKTNCETLLSILKSKEDTTENQNKIYLLECYIYLAKTSSYLGKLRREIYDVIKDRSSQYNKDSLMEKFIKYNKVKSHMKSIVEEFNGSIHEQSNKDVLTIHNNMKDLLNRINVVNTEKMQKEIDQEIQEYQTKKDEQERLVEDRYNTNAINTPNPKPKRGVFVILSLFIALALKLCYFTNTQPQEDQ